MVRVSAETRDGVQALAYQEFGGVSAFHLGVTRDFLLTVHPMTNTERAGWLHRVQLDMPNGRVAGVKTGQMRTVAATRLADRKPIYKLDARQIADLRNVLAQMVDVS